MPSSPKKEPSRIVDLKSKDNLVIVGQSGVGKSSRLRAIADLWAQGSGRILHPVLRDIYFLLQRPYMLLGSLRDQMLYPRMLQRLVFARLFINRPGFAVLDEATSALDTENEAMLYRKLQTTPYFMPSI